MPKNWQREREAVQQRVRLQRRKLAGLIERTRRIRRESDQRLIESTQQLPAKLVRLLTAARTRASA